MPPLDLLRRIAAPAVVAMFLVFIFFRGIGWQSRRVGLDLSGQASGKRPDFSQYVFRATLGEDELALGAGHRVIFVGDIHGQSLALEALLNELKFSEEKDTLVHTGDIVAKGTLSGSRTVLTFMTAHSIHGVRGNHDQKVIEWRAWIEWVRPMEDGEGGRWLDRLEQEYAAWVYESEFGEDEVDEDDVEAWIETLKGRRKGKDKRWWNLVPKGWKMLGDHYQIARSMTPEQYTYLQQLPLALHLPSEHAFVVHAGLLPYDITRPMQAKGQPLARAPRGESEHVPDRRTAQEVAVLTDVPQNNDPFNLLNMRNVLHDHTISKSTNRGKPWYSNWNTIMPKCVGFDPPAEHDVSNDKWMPCEPITVIYGHTASRGLDIHRWTIGLDSGCVYGRRLTALVLDAAHEHRKKGKKILHLREDESEEMDEEEAKEEAKAKEKSSITFGDDGQGRLVSVKCHKHKEKKKTGDLPDRI